MMRQAQKERIAAAFERALIQKILIYAGEIEQQVPAGSMAGLAERIAGLPPAAQAALAENQVPEATVTGTLPGGGLSTGPGGGGVSMKNIGRTGVPRPLSQTAVQEITP